MENILAFPQTIIWWNIYESSHDSVIRLYESSYDSAILLLRRNESIYSSVSHLVVVLCDTLWPHWLTALQAPLPMEFTGKSTGVGSHFLLQGLFPTQGSNPSTPHCRQVLYFLSRQGSPNRSVCPHKNAYGSIVRKSQKMETAHPMGILWREGFWKECLIPSNIKKHWLWEWVEIEGSWNSMIFWKNSIL